MRELVGLLPHISRDRVRALLDDLRSEGRIHPQGQKRGARWFPGPEGDEADSMTGLAAPFSQELTTLLGAPNSACAPGCATDADKPWPTCLGPDGPLESRRSANRGLA